MKISSPSALLLDQMRDLYSVEKQVVATMPHLADLSTNPALQSQLRLQREISSTQKDRLEQAAALLEGKLGGDVSKAMQGLIEGGNQHIEVAEGDETRDSIIVAHVNRIYHYEIAGYGFATTLAEQIGDQEVGSLLRESFEEEKAGARVLAENAAEIFLTSNATGD